MDKEIVIENGVITVREFGYPEYQFRIITGCIPGAYHIWNVSKDMLPRGYIPLCRLSDRQQYPGGMDIDADALLAIKAEGADIILDAIGFGPNSLKPMESFAQENRYAKPGSLKYNNLQRVKRALPYMRKLRWI